MSSLLTNVSALTALQSLDMTQQNLATTQAQISTGLKVANASDNAAYWSIAQSLQANTGVGAGISHCHDRDVEVRRYRRKDQRHAVGEFLAGLG